MASWDLVPAAERIFYEFNQIAPHRDHTTDGSIGDQAHADRSSDHNPDESGATPDEDSDSKNEVHAIDVDKDLNADFTMEDCIQYFLSECRKSGISGKDKGRLKYIIYNKRIWEASNGWNQRAYTGDNDHSQHAHFSFEYDSQFSEDDSSWGLIERFGDDMPTAEEIAKAVWAYEFKRPDGPTADGKTHTSAGGYQCYNDVVNESSANAAAKHVIDTLTPLILSVDTDEQTVVEGVLAGLAGAEGAADTIADAVVKALPADLATDVANQILAKQGQAMVDASQPPTA